MSSGRNSSFNVDRAMSQSNVRNNNRTGFQSPKRIIMSGDELFYDRPGHPKESHEIHPVYLPGEGVQLGCMFISQAAMNKLAKWYLDIHL